MKKKFIKKLLLNKKSIADLDWVMANAQSPKTYSCPPKTQCKCE